MTFVGLLMYSKTMQLMTRSPLIVLIRTKIRSVIEHGVIILANT